MRKVRTLTGAAWMILQTAVAAAQPLPDGPTERTDDRLAATADAQLADIVVTARRREESMQNVPVAITAFTGEGLRQSNVISLKDLTAVTPGLRFSSEGDGTTTSIALRGLSKVPLGATLPAVVTYFAEVALPTWGIDVPSFDLTNVQVLKGPQGTLFGRNTLGGAVLVTPETPNYTLGGYVDASVGNYDFLRFEGALNLPLIDNVLALRIAGNVNRRDGFVRDLNGGKSLSNVHTDAFRASLLFEPSPGISNTLIFDYFKGREQASASLPWKLSPGVGALPEPYASGVRAVVARQQELGLSKVYYSTADFLPGENLRDDRKADRESFGFVNTTRIDITDNILLKNIFGYRRQKMNNILSSGGVNSADLPGPLGELTILNVGAQRRRELLTDEIQLQGTTGPLTWIVGAIYTKDASNGPEGDYSRAFSFANFTGPIVLGTADLSDKSKALFGQGTLDLSEWLLNGLKVTAGYRHSWDAVSGCTAPDLVSFLDKKTCTDRAERNLPDDGVGLLKAKSDGATYTLGLDWQATAKTLFYVVHRKGYRAANLNPPKFESPFTTGASSGCGVAGDLPCPNVLPLQYTRPETITDIELGAKMDWSMGSVNGRLNVAIYENKLKKAVQFINVAPLGVPSSAPDFPAQGALGVNAADIRNRGVEVEGSIRPAHGLNIFFNGSHNVTKVLRIADLGSLSLSENEINRPTPKFSGTAGFDLTLPVRPLNSDVVFRVEHYRSSSWRPQQGVPLPGYKLTDVRLSLSKIAGLDMDASLWVTNAFNEKYATAPIVVVPAFPMQSIIPGEPRMYGLSLRYRFGH